MSSIKEENSAGGGAIAGIGVGDKGEPGMSQSKILRRKFAGHEVFDVESDYFHKCKDGKKKFHKYEDYVGNDEQGEAIRQYGRDRKTQKLPIIVADKRTGAMLYLKYGKK